MTQIHLAKSAGFCFGVSRAVDRVNALLDAGRRVCTLGPIIHNPQVVEKLAARGVTIVDAPEQTPPGAVLVIRSHGVPQEIMDRARACGAEVCDATCPFVEKIHRIVREQSAAGAAVIIIGNAAHPEVEGIRGHCTGRVFVFDDPESLEKWCKTEEISPQTPAVMVSQTTFPLKTWEKCAEIAKKNTIQTFLFLLQYVMRLPKDRKRRSHCRRYAIEW